MKFEIALSLLLAAPPSLQLLEYTEPKDVCRDASTVSSIRELGWQPLFIGKDDSGMQVMLITKDSKWVFLRNVDGKNVCFSLGGHVVFPLKREPL
jgi:hypothetical protein